MWDLLYHIQDSGFHIKSQWGIAGGFPVPLRPSPPNPHTHQVDSTTSSSLKITLNSMEPSQAYTVSPSALISGRQVDRQIDRKIGRYGYRYICLNAFTVFYIWCVFTFICFPKLKTKKS